ncbi:MAG: ribosomal protein S18-alanine N-acetyltransferase [Candidatus Nezhaarchaeales archaeon]
MSRDMELSKTTVNVKGIIRPIKKNDWKKVYDIEKLCFGDKAYPKPLLQYLAILHGDTFLVYEVDGDVLGYAVGAYEHNGRGHILSIATRPDVQARGIGRALLEALIERLRGRGANRFRLEVRVSNIVAIKFYEKMGFKVLGVIKSYYEDGEDAIVYVKDSC